MGFTCLENIIVHQGRPQQRVLNILDLLSSPGPSLSPSPCPNRPPSRIQVPQKRKKEGFEPLADTKITVLIVKVAQNDPLDSPSPKN